MASIEEERLLLQNEESLLQKEVSLYAEDGSVDMHGNPPLKKKTGTWKACPFILGNECCERLAYFGIAKNLVTYFTTELHETNVSAARHVMLWQATCYISPLIGALMADAYWGRYWTIAGFSAIYVMGMSVLTLSASIPGLKPAECSGSLCPSATPVQYAVFFSGLYLMALGTGGIKPCVSSFGADQFDDNDSRERVKKASFFNWFFFSIHIGSLISTTFLVWVQEKCGWGLGLLIPTVFMGLSIASFFSGTFLYRFQKPSGSPITRVFQVLVAAYRKLNLKLPEDHTVLYETPDKNSAISGSRKMEHTDGYRKFSALSLSFHLQEKTWLISFCIYNLCRCLDKAAVITEQETRSGSFPNPWKICTVTQIEEVKVLIRMFPIWACGIVYPTLHSQIFTLYVQQGRTMNRTIGSFEIPPATLGVFDTTSILICIPIYDRIVVPVVRRITGKPKGFTDLQRMGLGLFSSVLSMSMAAIVEIFRLKLARDLDLVESGASVPMSIFWQVPQFFLMGTSGVLFYVGRLEFFYEQSPDAMRSVCSAWGLLASSIGIYFSSMILTLVAYFTTRDGGSGWIPPANLNKGHLDYYFWLLAFIGSVNMPVFVYFAVRYKQKKVS